MLPSLLFAARNLGADESPSSTFASPFPSPFSHFNDLRITSPGTSQEPLNHGFIQMTLCDTASPIAQNRDGIGNLSRLSKHSDGGGFPASYQVPRRSKLDRLRSPLIAQIPNVDLNNGLGLTFSKGHPPVQEKFFVGQGQTSSYVHAPLSPDPHMRPSPALSPLGIDISNELSFGPAFAAADHTEDWAYFPSLSSSARDEHPGGSYFAPTRYTEDDVQFPSHLGCGFPPLGVDVDCGLSGGSYSAPASYSEYGSHFPSHYSFGPSTQGMDASDEPSGGAYYAPESYTGDGVDFLYHPGGGFPPPGVDVDRELFGGSYSAPASYSEGGAHFSSHFSCGLPPQGVDVNHGLFGGCYSAPERYIEGSPFPPRFSRDLPSRAVDVGYGPFDALCSSPASFTEDDTHLPWRSSCSLSPMGMGASNGPYSSPERYVLSKFPPSNTSARGALQSIFKDDRRDPMYDTATTASSSSAGWSGDTPELSSSPKKTVSTAKLRKASEKRRKKPGRFTCSICENTFTEKHNLISMYSPASLHFLP